MSFLGLSLPFKLLNIIKGFWKPERLPVHWASSQHRVHECPDKRREKDSIHGASWYCQAQLSKAPCVLHFQQPQTSRGALHQASSSLGSLPWLRGGAQLLPRMLLPLWVAAPSPHSSLTLSWQAQASSCFWKSHKKFPGQSCSQIASSSCSLSFCKSSWFHIVFLGSLGK